MTADGPFEVYVATSMGMASEPLSSHLRSRYVVGTFATLPEALKAAAEATPALEVPDEKRPTHELRFERDLAYRNLESIDRQRERLMARAFRLDRMLERREG